MPKFAVIDWENAMNQVGGDEDFLTEVLQDLLEESRSAKDEIKVAIEKKDWDTVKKAAHRIKGSASYLSCDEIKESALKLQDLGEAACKNCGSKLENAIIDEFETYKSAFINLERAIRKGHK
jgi:HPt (histidine-containing phosphotransfer) domain-containing protein